MRFFVITVALRLTNRVFEKMLRFLCCLVTVPIIPNPFGSAQVVSGFGGLLYIPPEMDEQKQKCCEFLAHAVVESVDVG